MGIYSPDKDKALMTFKHKTVGLTRLAISVHSYDGGEPKTQLTRLVRRDEDSEDWTFAKLGRLTLSEVKWFGRMMRKEVVPWVEEYLATHAKKPTKKAREIRSDE